MRGPAAAVYMEQDRCDNGPLITAHLHIPVIAARAHTCQPRPPAREPGSKRSGERGGAGQTEGARDEPGLEGGVAFDRSEVREVRRKAARLSTSDRGESDRVETPSPPPPPVTARRRGSTLKILGARSLTSRRESSGASGFSSCERNSFAICRRKKRILILMNIKWPPLKVKQIILGFSGSVALCQSRRAAMIFH